MSEHDAVVVGAGPAGLACAAALRQSGVSAVVLEKTNTVGATWRRHYDRLHLHTDRGHSGLPGLPMPRTYPRYPSRAQVVEYLETYAAQFGIAPIFDTLVTRISPQNGAWRVETDGEPYVAPTVIVATGMYDAPVIPSWPGQDTFTGALQHSSAYKNPEPFAGERVLVVGFGNSGGEIALDLAEAGIACALSVRSPVQVLPRDLLGLPILTWSIAEQWLPTRVADAINAPIIRLAVGSLAKLGLRRAAKGALTMVKEDGRIPLLDVGTIAKIREGQIAVRPGIKRFDGEAVVFVDETRETYEAVILATGFRPDLRSMLPDIDGVLDDAGAPLVSGDTTKQPGLFFCSFALASTGQLREIGIEAKRIATKAGAHFESIRNSLNDA